MPNEHIHFITGRLAEHALRAMVADLSSRYGFEYSIGVMPITVAALMTPAWIARNIEVPADCSRILLPGYCEGDLQPLSDVTRVPIEVGPRDLRCLHEFFGGAHADKEQYGSHDIEIIAEINHAPRLPTAEILATARRLAADGADIIDVGCEPSGTWSHVDDCVKRLKGEGFRVSIDSFDTTEIAAAVKAGAELVLSVNASNRDAAPDWGCEVVVIPDEFPTLRGLQDSVDFLAHSKVPLRIDPILEPIGCGFAASLERYAKVRREYPDAEMMMGIGNLTELTDVDSAGINVLLLAICQELGIRSVLTTQVINWARSSVQECDLARKMVHFAINHGQPPKHIEPRLVMLRDVSLNRFEDDYFVQLAKQIKDNNFRIFAEDERLHLVSAALHIEGDDPFLLFEQLLETKPKNVDASHAFYLGFEMAKAVIALTLGKEYRQDEALNWGLLTREERSHRLQRRREGPARD